MKDAGAVSIARPLSRWRGPGPSPLQWLFVVSYTALWIVATAPLPGALGRLERILTLLGLLAIPFVAGRRPRVSLVPPRAVTVGLVCLLATYFASFIANGPDAWGATFVIGLAGRACFMWIGFVLLQNKMMLHRAYWLLVASSIASVVWAIFLLNRYGLGAGRFASLEMAEDFGWFRISAYYSAQMTTVGAVLLLGAYSAFSRVGQWAALTVAATFTCVGYFTYFRREPLITVPIVLLVLLLSGAELDRRVAGAAALIFVGLAVWEFETTSSVLRYRMEKELGGFVSQDETRVNNAEGQLEAISRAPLLGYGAGQHASAIAPFAPASERYLSGFNIFGWLGVEGGLFCLLSYLVVLAAVFRRSWRRRSISGDSPEAVIIRGGPALVTQVVLWGVFGNSWENPLPWFVMGMILAALEVAERDAEFAPKRQEAGSVGPMERRAGGCG